MLQVATILVTMVKNIWQLKFQQKLHVGAQQILKKEKKILKNEVIQDVIYNMKGFDTNISVHFKWEMILSGATGWNCVKHLNLLLSLSNFVVNCFASSHWSFFILSLCWLFLQSFNHLQSGHWKRVLWWDCEITNCAM